MNKQLRKFFFILRKDEGLSKKDKLQMHDLLVETYPKPAFVKLYNKHGYYSTVKPQMNFLIKEGDKLVGTGKFLWRLIKIKNKKIKLFAFGMVVEKDYQNMGLGTNIAKLSVENAKKRNADILYASTSSQKVKKILNKLGFKKITTRVFYKNATTKIMERNKTFTYAFEYKKGLVEEINALLKIYIGIGPI